MLDVIVSTTQKNAVSFFQKNLDISKNSFFYIINQFGKIDDFKSSIVNVQNINYWGLSKSRNLGLNLSNNNIKLITDDDVIFLDDFDNKILQAHAKFPDADVIIFKAVTFKGEDFREYPTYSKYLTKEELRSICSIEITLKSTVVERFDENFGLGATFVAGEEWIFLTDIYNSGKKILFIPEAIVQHDEFCSGFNYDSRRLNAVSASYFRVKKLFAIPYILYFYILIIRNKKKYNSNINNFNIFSSLINGIIKFCRIQYF